MIELTFQTFSNLAAYEKAKTMTLYGITFGGWKWIGFSRLPLLKQSLLFVLSYSWALINNHNFVIDELLICRSLLLLNHDTDCFPAIGVLDRVLN